MLRIDALYAIERENKSLSPVVRSLERQKKAVPLLEALHACARSLEQKTLPSGKLGEALAYLLKQWPKLTRYVEDGRLAFDTNLAENAHAKTVANFEALLPINTMAAPGQ